jgi:hypothetical protein
MINFIQKNKENTEVYAENNFIFYGTFHYDCFNFNDFHYKQVFFLKMQ